MPPIVTDPGLLSRLAAAAARGVTRQESREQKVSFVYGNLPKGSPMTRHQIREMLEKGDEVIA